MKNKNSHKILNHNSNPFLTKEHLFINKDKKSSGSCSNINNKFKKRIIKSTLTRTNQNSDKVSQNSWSNRLKMKNQKSLSKRNVSQSKFSL